jgi:branched-chain amino acid transport system ATP-binding protein
MALLEAAGLRAGYGSGNQVLHGVDVSLDPSGVTALSGVNGAGKSTLAGVLAGRIGVSAGTILFEGTPITATPIQERVRRGIVLCPQGREVFPQLSVAENLRLGALPLPPGQRSAAIDDVLDALPVLATFLATAAGSLSGGQQQLLALGRAAAARPRVLIVDEPSMGLAPSVVDTVYAYLRRLHEEGVALLVIEESPLRLNGLADHVMVLRRGQVTQRGGVELLANEAVLTSALLGEGASA